MKETGDTVHWLNKNQRGKEWVKQCLGRKKIERQDQERELIYKEDVNI